MTQVLEKLDLLTIIVNSRFESLEKGLEAKFQGIKKSVEDKYHELNDRLIDIGADASYHHFKIMEYFKATGHEHLPSPTPSPSPLNSPPQGE